MSGGELHLVAGLLLALSPRIAPAAIAMPQGAAPVEALVEREVAMMGTALRLRVEHDSREAALAASERALDALGEVEERLSTWLPTTELMALNRAPVKEPHVLSPALAADLGAALRCADATAGGFDPTVGALVDAWGLRRGGVVPDLPVLEAARAASGHQLLGLESGIAVRRHPGVRLEEGGFGKGAGLDAAATALEREGVHLALLDLGGQLLVVGSDRAVPASIAHPRDRRQELLRVGSVRGSLATSGNGVRGRQIGADWIGHLLDPASGRPVPDPGLSVSVEASSALWADCLATGLFVLAARAGVDAALARGEAAGAEVVVLVPTDAGYEARATEGICGRLQPVGERVAIACGTRTAPSVGGAALERGAPPGTDRQVEARPDSRRAH